MLQVNTAFVTNNTKQGLIVILMFLGGVMILAIWGMINQGRQARAYALAGVSSSMERSYAEVLTNKTDSQRHGVILITREALRTAFCGTNDGQLRFPSFIPTKNIWLSADPVELKTTNLLCVAGAFDKMYGIDGNGLFREVSEKEFSKWPHVSTQPTTDH